MLNYIFIIYSYIFARKNFVLFHKFLYHISLRGLGILNHHNSYLAGEKQWLSRYLKNINNPIVIDVGANIGGYVNDVFEANISSFVYAFEPHPITYRKLNNNIANDKLKTFNPRESFKFLYSINLENEISICLKAGERLAYLFFTSSTGSPDGFS